MARNDAIENEQSLTTQTQRRALHIANALPMRLQTLDLDRENVIAPDGKRYVVATYDDRRVGRGYITVIYPQQNDYLTLVRLPLLELSSDNPDEAMNKHADVIQAIVQGRMDEFIQSAQSM